MTDVTRKTLASNNSSVISSFTFLLGHGDSYFLGASFIDLLKWVLGLMAGRPLQKDHDITISSLACIDSLNFIFPGSGWGLERGLFETGWWGCRSWVWCVLPMFLTICFVVWSRRSRRSTASLLRFWLFLLSILAEDSLAAADALEVFI